MAKRNTKAYSVTNQVTRENGNTHGHIMHMGPVEFEIPQEAVQRPGADGDYWNWEMQLPDGTRILLQAYGPAAVPGRTATFQVEVREKQFSKQKGGHKFIYCKLRSTDEAATHSFDVAGGGYLRQLEDFGHPDIAIVWCPQERHDGGVFFAPLLVPVPPNRSRSRVFTRKNQSA